MYDPDVLALLVNLVIEFVMFTTPLAFHLIGVVLSFVMICFICTQVANAGGWLCVLYVCVCLCVCVCVWSHGPDLPGIANTGRGGGIVGKGENEGRSGDSQ